MKNWYVSDWNTPTAAGVSDAVDIAGTTITGDQIRNLVADKDAPIRLTAELEANTFSVKLNPGDGKLKLPEGMTNPIEDKVVNATSGAIDGLSSVPVPTAPEDYSKFVGYSVKDPSGETVKVTDASGNFVQQVTWKDADGNAKTTKLGDLINALTGNEDGQTIELNAVYKASSERKTNIYGLAVADVDGEFGTITMSDGRDVTDTFFNGSKKFNKDSLTDLTAKAKKGYEFVGWYVYGGTGLTTYKSVEDYDGKTFTDGTAELVTDKATLTVKQMNDAKRFYVKGNDTDHGTPEADVTFVALFKQTDAVKFNISFDANGGTLQTGKVAPKPVEYDSNSNKNVLLSADDAADTWKNDNYIFVGWSLDKDAAQGDYKKVFTSSTAAIAKEQLTADDSDKTVYAIWAPADGTRVLEFTAENGTVSESTIVATKGKALPGDLKVTAKGSQGHKFDGWYVRTVNKTTGKVTDTLVTKDGKKLQDNKKNAYTSEDITRSIIVANVPGVAVTNNEGTFTFVAKYTPMTYSATFGSEVRTYTVGEDGTPFPEGKWMYGGEEITSKAQLDALVTEDGQIFTLVEEKGSDKTSLQEAVTEAEKVDPSAYTDETAKAFTDALAAAQAVLKDEAATQAQVEKAATDLAVAKAGLKEKPADGWHQAGTDSWQYAEGGEYVKGAWVSDGGEWYYMDANGFMLDGWMQDSDGNWYFLSQNHDGTFGAMVTGWVMSDGNWYYMNPNAGGPKGAMMTGWQWVNGKCYYLYEQTGGPKGACAISTTINGWQVGADGAWIQ